MSTRRLERRLLRLEGQLPALEPVIPMSGWCDPRAAGHANRRRTYGDKRRTLL